MLRLFLFSNQIDLVLLQFNMDRVNAEEFMEVYKGVVAEYTVSICCCTFFYDFNWSTNENMDPLYVVILVLCTDI